MEDKKSLILQKMGDAGKPLKPGDIAEMVGMSKDEVSKLINELKKENRVYSPKRCFYQPK